MRVALLAILMLLCPGSSAVAQTDPRTGADLITYGLPAGACAEAISTPVSFEAAATTPLECASVEGLIVWADLFEGIEGYYRVNRGGRYVLRSSLIPIYGLSRFEPPERPRPARLTGRTGECQDIYGPDAVMVSPDCRLGEGGPYIALGEMTLLGETPERLTGEAVRTRLGLLVEPSSDWTHRAYVEARARHWLSLVRDNDPAAYSAAAELYGKDADLDDPDGDLHAVFRASGTVFERLRAEPSPSLKIWTITRPEPDTVRGPPLPGDVTALVCFKLGTWQDDRWPVAPADADNNDARPFACVMILRWTTQEEDLRPGEVIEAYSITSHGPGLGEPAAFGD